MASDYDTFIDYRPKVLVISLDPLALAGLVAILGDQPEVQVAGQTSNDSAIAGLLETVGPNVVVWDLGPDPTDALEHQSELRDLLPPTLSLVPDAVTSKQARSVGSYGAVLRNVDGDRLAAAVIAIDRGLIVIDPDLNTESQGPEVFTGPLVESLTAREPQVLNLLAEGLANKAIARRLDITEHTVKYHVNSILGKLSAGSRTEAVTRATRLGLILL